MKPLLMLSRSNAYAHAAGLLSEGDNPEYDRALAEFIADSFDAIPERTLQETALEVLERLYAIANDTLDPSDL